jgi:NADH:ubiquinone oxidoreductase subunit 5 (subunit L)/multisubunit Na+/H+ antiporter MnhA subunit
MLILIIPSPIFSWSLFLCDSQLGELLDCQAALDLDYIYLEEYEISLWFYQDTFSLLFLSMLCTISFVIHLYVLWYMYDDYDKCRFVSILSLFTFGMGLLIISGDVVCIFIGWELIGISSLFLISYYTTQIDALRSGLKAISYNRIGDIGLLIFICFEIYRYEDCCLVVVSYPFNSLYDWREIGLYGLVLAAWVKSAQFGASPWLLCAMSGPTPVSALLHSATLVTAGLLVLVKLESKWYGLCNLSLLIFILGAVTALVSCLAAVVFFDLKRIIAYSTCTHIGLIFMSLGLSGIVQADLSYYVGHLFTHGLTKSLLFLLAGVMIHKLHQQDIRSFRNMVYLQPLFFVISLLCGIFGLFWVFLVQVCLLVKRRC